MAPQRLERPIGTLPHLSAVSLRLPVKQCQYLPGWTQIILDLGGWNVSRFFLHSSFRQAISAVMLWPAHVQKVPQASEHLCPAKLQTRCEQNTTENILLSWIQSTSKQTSRYSPHLTKKPLPYVSSQHSCLVSSMLLRPCMNSSHQNTTTLLYLVVTMNTPNFIWIFFLSIQAQAHFAGFLYSRFF